MRQPSLLFSMLFVFCSVLVVLAVTTPVAQAAYSADDDALLYYQIGGGSAAALPSTYAESVTLGGSLDLSSSYSCGDFNVLSNLKQLFDTYRQGLDEAVHVLEYALQNAVANLPLYLLRRADPNLANMFEKAMARYEEYITLATRSCEEMQNMIMDGEDPYHDWITLSRKTAWDDAGKEAKADPNNGPTATETRDKVNQDGGNVVWKDGNRAAGKGQETIKVIADVVDSGYGMLADGAGPSGEESRIKALWPSVDDARTWANDVLGEYIVSTDPDKAPESIQPVGIAPRVSKLTEELAQSLGELASGATEPDADNLKQLSGGGTTVTPALIRALKALPNGARSVYVERLASEMALAQAAEEIMLMRRILTSGVREPNIANTPAWKNIQQWALPDLDREYRYLKDENALRREFVSNTATALLKRDAVARQQPPVNSLDLPPTPLTHGAVLKKDVPQ